MAVPITIPRLGWNMDEGTFAGWIKQDGETVRAGDLVFTLEAEKATQEIESLDHGVLRIDPAGPSAGERVAVGVVIGYLTEPGEAAPFETAAATAGAVEQADGERPAVPAPVHEPPVPTGPRRQASSPRARRVARELGIDWTHLHGTGRSGRVRERDVRAAAAQHGPAASPIRRAIAQHMLASVRATAAVTLTTTADVSNLVNLRDQFRAAAPQAAGPVPGYTDFVVKLAAAALQQHPSLAARWDDGRIVPAARLDIGIAVDTDAGLLVPVLRDVPALGVRAVASQASELAERARRGALAARDLRGGAFTVTNLGAFGIDAFTPIINAPECAILGMGRIQRRPVAVAEQVVVRDQMTLSLTFDHRIVDGAPAARFLQALVRLLDNPGPWLVA
jgi:pyruvate dehydrogenase E2 component (dihydrolipoamide acetyltransferase)